MPADGPVAWTSHADLAEAAVIALTGDRLDGLTPALTGSEAIDMAGIAAIASDVTGRPIRHLVVSDEEYRAGLIAQSIEANSVHGSDSAENAEREIAFFFSAIEICP